MAGIVENGKWTIVYIRGLRWLLVATALAAGCVAPGERTKGTDPTPGTRVVKDDLGRNVSLPLRIERAVSLAPSLTEIIFAVGAGDRLVGVTTYCNYPPRAQAIQKVSDTQTPNIESMIALRPEVVFVTTASQLEAFSATLEGQGISVYVTNPAKMDDVFRSMVQLGELLGSKEEAMRVTAELEARTARVRERAFESGDTRNTPRVFVQISNEPLFTIGKESFLTQVVESAGGISVTSRIETAYPKLSKETAMALNPDVIVLSDSDDNREPNAVFRTSPAIRGGRVYRIDADIISRPGPRLVDALEQIARLLHGSEASERAASGGR